jgi:large subunit ribosomal protein L19
VNLVDIITKKQIRTDLPEFRVGDTVKVNVIIKEKNAKGIVKSRIQVFEGIVMAIQGAGVGKTFIVRKMSSGVGVERTFPINTPIIESVTVVRKGKVRQAKLNYLRTLKKVAKIKERN